jgi:hypothetical protein
MNRVVFFAVMTSVGLTMPGLAPARPEPYVAAPEAERAVSMIRTPAATWTCAHNRYRSVACP